ncbi:MAG: MotA/TolQ/ExbB proton channel family protein [Proteobacteria bacterium]|nr:MotA/TolQ/ExbB proton channel family protein [Pseudomonadota bacterium]
MIILELLAKRNLPNDERESYFSMQLLQSEQALFRYLPLLKILATVSPLLGLLGTVLGMINAFELISTIDKPITPSLVAGGISQALITTAAGLMIAIPALIAHSLFQMRINRLIQQFTRQLNIVNLHIQNSSRTVN